MLSIRFCPAGGPVKIASVNPVTASKPTVIPPVGREVDLPQGGQTGQPSPAEKPYLCISGALPAIAIAIAADLTPPCVGDVGQDSPFGDMRRPTGRVCRSAWLQRETEIGLLHPVRGSGAADVGRADPSDSPSLAPTHSLYTQSRIHPQAVHTTVMLPP